MNFIEKWVNNTHPLIVAIICDLVQLVPFVDSFFTIPTQYYLWFSRLKHPELGAIIMGEDLLGDFLFFFGDLTPLNTIFVLVLMVKGERM
jgi:hypothetical protein